jgi:hypothetical protein
VVIDTDAPAGSLLPVLARLLVQISRRERDDKEVEQAHAA